MADEKKSGTGLAALVAVLAVFLGGPRVADQRAAPATKEAAPSPRGPGTSPQTPTAGPSGRRVIEPLRIDREVSRHGADGATAIRPLAPGKLEIAFQIITVPDPIDTRFGHRFDTALDAIQLAVESQGYALDRFYFPWRPEGDQPGRGDLLKPIRDPASTGPAREVSELSAIFGAGPDPESRPLFRLVRESGSAPRPSSPASARPRHESEPGVLLFRAGLKEPDRYCAIFLVGESPVSGIHKDAMALALDMVWEHHRAAGPAARPTIRVVGPYFSSGAASLSRAISDWATSDWAITGRWGIAAALPGVSPPPREVFPAVEVRCGSAISVNPGEFIKACRPARVGFKATVLPYPVVMSGLLDYLKELNGGKLEKVAILHESSTTFGQSVNRSHDRKGNYDKYDLDFNLYFEDDSYTIISYPFHISQVAIEYSDRKARGQEAQPTLAKPSSRLQVPFDDAGTPSDSVPSLSPRMTAARDEFALATILSTLAREDYRYVGIVASDIRDVIFLAEMIREFCPDVRLFNLDTDLILAHPEYVDKLRGTILASPYPLHGATQQWTPPSRGGLHRQVFAYISDQGCYNAVLAGFADAAGDLRKKLEDAGRPAPAGGDVAKWPMNSAYDYGPPEPPRSNPYKTRPPVWIGVVGAHGLWPLAYRVPGVEGGFKEAYDEYVYTAEMGAPEDEPESEASKDLAPASWGWMSTYFGLGAMILVLCWASDVAVGGMRPQGSGWHILYRFWPLHDPATRRAQVFYIRCGLWMLGMIFIPVSSDVFAWLFGLAKIHPRAGAAAAFYALAVAVVNVVGLGRRFEPDGAAGAAPVRRGRIVWMTLMNASLAALSCLVTFAIRGSAAFIEDWLEIIELHIHVAVMVALLNSIWVRDGRAAAARSEGAAGAPTPPEAGRDDGPRLGAIVGVVTLMTFEALVALRFAAGGAWCVPGSFSVGRDLFLDRVKALNNGVSPIMPLILLALGFALSLLNRLRILYLYDRVLNPRDPSARRPSLYFVLDVVLDLVDLIRGRRARTAAPARDPALDLSEVDQFCDEVDGLLIRSTRVLGSHPFFLMALGLMSFAMFRLLARVIPTPDGRLFTWAFVAMVCGSTLVVATAFSRFLLLWFRLRYLLRALVLHPMQAAYDRLPAMIGQTYGRYLDRYDPRLSSLRPGVQQLMALAGRDPEIKAIALRAYGIAVDSPGVAAGQGARREIEERFEAEVRQGEFGDVRESPTRIALRAAASHCLRKLREEHWPMLAVRDGYRMAAPDGPPAGREEVTASGPESEPFPALAEEFLAMEFLAIVNQYAAHLRSLATYLAIAPLLLIWAIESYPFLPQRYMLVLLGGTWGTIVAGVVFVYVQMDRDPFLSHVSRTPPNHVTFDRTFLTSVLTMLIPILGVFLTQFPFFSDAITQWLGPILRSLR